MDDSNDLHDGTTHEYAAWQSHSWDGVPNASSLEACHARMPDQDDTHSDSDWRAVLHDDTHAVLHDDTYSALYDDTTAALHGVAEPVHHMAPAAAAARDGHSAEAAEEVVAASTRVHDAEQQLAQAQQDRQAAHDRSAQAAEQARQSAVARDAVAHFNTAHGATLFGGVATAAVINPVFGVFAGLGALGVAGYDASNLQHAQEVAGNDASTAAEAAAAAEAADAAVLAAEAGLSQAREQQHNVMEEALAANPGALLPVVNGFTHAPHDGQQLQPPSAELFPLERPGGSDREVLVTIYTPSERHAAIAIEPVGRTAGGQVMYEAGVRSNNTGHSVGELLQDPTSSVFVGYRGDAAPGVDSIREDPTGRLQSDQQIELGRWRGLYSSPDPDTAAAYALGEDGRTLGAVSQVVLHPDIQRFAAELPNDHPLADTTLDFVRHHAQDHGFAYSAPQGADESLGSIETVVDPVAARQAVVVPANGTLAFGDDGNPRFDPTNLEQPAPPNFRVWVMGPTQGGSTH